jgi:glyoxylase-like metal-dependent hydrolase (beta-lactamase superfamily II)
MIRLATNMFISNVWLLEHQGKRYLVDTGYTLERLQLRARLHRWGIRGKGDLHGVILTHRHGDHAANAAWLRQTYDAPIICHEADARILCGECPAPKLVGVPKQSWYERVVCTFEDLSPVRVKVDESLSEGRWRNDWEIIDVHGHTEGSIMLQHLPSATLFSGDAILAGPAPQRLFERLTMAMPGFSLDVGSTHQLVQAYVERLQGAAPIRQLCAGHGPLVDKDTTHKLRAMVGVL